MKKIKYAWVCINLHPFEWRVGFYGDKGMGSNLDLGIITLGWWFP